MAGLGAWFVHGGVRAVRIGPVWYARANSHTPAGPVWLEAAPQRGFAPLGVPRGRMEHRGPRARGLAEIPGVEPCLGLTSVSPITKAHCSSSAPISAIRNRAVTDGLVGLGALICIKLNAGCSLGWTHRSSTGTIGPGANSAPYGVRRRFWL